MEWDCLVCNTHNDLPPNDKAVCWFCDTPQGDTKPPEGEMCFLLNSVCLVNLDDCYSCQLAIDEGRREHGWEGDV